jgi:hypothetical protein
VRQLVAEFNRLPSLRGAVACPNDDGSEIVAWLAYPGGHQVPVSVGLTGCALVTNGSVHRTAAGFGTPRAFGPQLLTSLEQLVGANQRSNAGSANALALGQTATNHWSVTSKAPVGPFNAPTAVWTGTRVILAGMTRGTPTLQVAS